jgi:MFS family permease
LTYSTICFYTFLSTVNASNLSVAIVPLTEYFHISTSKASYLLCFNTLILGFANLVWVPLTRKFGKRPIYLIAPLIMVATNAWSYKAKSFGSLLAARILSGFAAGAGDAPVPAIVADLFPVTERGFALMFFQLALSSGFFIGPFINAFVTQYSGGWQWTCGWIAIAAGVNWVVAVFTVWETSHPSPADDSRPIEPKLGFMDHLSLTRGYKKDVNAFRVLADILMLAIYPPITWGGILTGIFVGW